MPTPQDRLKSATHARNYGASELMLATLTGRYPPPHHEMDAQRPKSPTVNGNVRCMDCRCNGYGCPGMPPGYEQRLMDNW